MQKIIRYVVCSLALALFVWGLKTVLHSLQWIGLGPYLLVCAGLVCVSLLFAWRADVAAGRSLGLMPTNQPRFRLLSYLRRSPPGA